MCCSHSSLPPTLLPLFSCFLAGFRPCHLFEAANEIDNGSSRASVLCLKKRLHANCFMPPQKRWERGRPILTASGRPNEIPFVIKPRVLDNDGGQRVPSAALEIYPHFPRVRYVPCFAPKDFSQLITTHRRSVTTTITTTSPCLPISHKRKLCWLLCLSSISKIYRL